VVLVPCGAAAHKNKQVEALDKEGRCVSCITECLTVTLLQISVMTLRLF